MDITGILYIYCMDFMCRIHLLSTRRSKHHVSGTVSTQKVSTPKLLDSTGFMSYFHGLRIYF